MRALHPWSRRIQAEITAMYNIITKPGCFYRLQLRSSPNYGSKNRTPLPFSFLTHALYTESRVILCYGYTSVCSWSVSAEKRNKTRQAGRAWDWWATRSVYSRRCGAFSRSPAANWKANAPAPIFGSHFPAQPWLHLPGKHADNAECLTSARCVVE